MGMIVAMVMVIAMAIVMAIVMAMAMMMVMVMVTFIPQPPNQDSREGNHSRAIPYDFVWPVQSWPLFYA